MASAKLLLKVLKYAKHSDMKLNQKDKHIFLKCVEELNELAVELIQSVNKENKNNWGKIFDEVEDVEKYIKLLKGVKSESFK